MPLSNHSIILTILDQLAPPPLPIYQYAHEQPCYCRHSGNTLLICITFAILLVRTVTLGPKASPPRKLPPRLQTLGGCKQSRQVKLIKLCAAPPFRV